MAALLVTFLVDFVIFFVLLFFVFLVVFFAVELCALGFCVLLPAELGMLLPSPTPSDAAVLVKINLFWIAFGLV